MEAAGEEKKYFSKNIKEVELINETNCLKMLSPDDWEMLFETDEENYRRGNFKRIFPSTPDQNEYYTQFFEYPRFNNAVVF
jgi:tubulin polyglutamylase TTLL4